MAASNDSPPIACTLTPGEFQDRLAWVADLTCDALRRHERHDLALVLTYAPDAADRVRELVRREQTCCSFLTFDLREEAHEIRLTITAPERARIDADMLFESKADRDICLKSGMEIGVKECFQKIDELLASL